MRCRVENLEKFKSNDGDCPTLVCTDLAARGLDLDVDHVIMFDFPSNSVSHESLLSLFPTLLSHNLILLVFWLFRLIISIALEELLVWGQKVLYKALTLYELEND